MLWFATKRSWLTNSSTSLLNSTVEFRSLKVHIPPDMVNTVNKKQVSIASFFIGLPMLATRFINIFQFMTRGGVIV